MIRFPKILSLLFRKKTILWGMSGLFLIILSSPIWSLWLTGKILNHYGIHYESFEADGLTKVALNGLIFETEAVEVKIEEINAPHPLLLLVGSKSRISASDWVLNIVKTDPSSTGTKPPISLPLITNATISILESITNKVEQIELNLGSLNLSKRSIVIEQVYLDSTSLLATLQTQPLPGSTFLLVSEWQNEETILSLTNDSSHLKLESVVTVIEDQLSIKGAISRKEIKVPFSVLWGTQSILPSHAEIRLDETNIPIKDKVYRKTGYVKYNADAYMIWDSGEWKISATGTAIPNPEFGKFLEPLDFKFSGHGDSQSANIFDLRLNSDWLQFNLDNEILIFYSDWDQASEFKLTLSADLSKQDFIPLSGLIAGSIDVARGEYTLDEALNLSTPQATIKLHADNVTWEERHSGSLQILATFQSDSVKLESLHFEEAEGTTLDMSGKADLKNRIFEQLKLITNIKPETLPDGLPEDWDFESLKVETIFEGALTNPSHVSSFFVTQLEGPFINPLNITMEGIGTGTQFDELIANITEPEGSESFQVNASGGKDKMGNIILDTEARFASGNTAHFSWSQNNESQRQLQSNARTLSSEDLSPFFKIDPSVTGLEINNFKFNAQIDEENPILLQLEGVLDWELEDWGKISNTLNLSSSGAGVEINTMEVTQNGERVASVVGKLPLSLSYNNGIGYEFLENESPVHLSITSSMNPALVTLLKTSFGIKVEGVVLNASITGEPDNLHSELDLSIDKVESLENETIPAIENLELKLDLQDKLLSLKQLTFEVLEKPILIQGTSTWNKEHWKALFSPHTEIDWSDAKGTMEFTETPISTFHEFLPRSIRRQGTLSANLTIEPGLNIQGNVHFNDLATRPIPPFVASHGLKANLDFSGRTLQITHFTGILGDKPWTMVGTIDFPKEQSAILDLQFIGDSLPMVRTSGLILNASPRLSIQTDNEGVTNLTGDLLLKNSILTINIKDLASGGNSGGSNSKPPYFAVTEMPFADWLLDVHIEGDNFMKIKTTAFDGVASADFNLRGFMKNPISIGNAGLSSGNIKFPFANFKISHAQALTTLEDPYTYQLDAEAYSRTYGYDLKMELTGTSDSPSINFSSSPSLEPSEIVMLVTTGMSPNSSYEKTDEKRMLSAGVYLSQTLLASFGLGGGDFNRLEITFGEDISAAGKETIEARLKINEDWTLEGAYDRFDSYNLDVQWKVFEK